MNDRILYTIIAAIIPLTVLVAGVWMRFFTPENQFFGYRTSMSRKNALTWEFANRHSGLMLIIVSLVLIPVSLLVMLFIPDGTSESAEMVFIVLSIVQCTALLAASVSTEIALHQHFDKNGNPR